MDSKTAMMNDEEAPPYTEVAYNTSSEKSQSGFIPLPPSLLPQHLTDTRTQRIQAILTRYIDPLLIAQGAAGLYKTTFILVPSTVSSLQSSPSDAYTNPQEPQVMGFPPDETVKLVRLQGEENSMEFWRQPAVVAELDSALRARLAACGHRVYVPNAYPEQPEVSQPPPPVQEPMKSKEKKSFWGRLNTDVSIEDRKLGWRTEEPQGADRLGNTPTGQVKVTVAWNQVALRIENEMGLYDTQRGPALCVAVEVGS